MLYPEEVLCISMDILWTHEPASSWRADIPFLPLKANKLSFIYWILKMQ
jgi:hypothetical protein